MDNVSIVTAVVAAVACVAVAFVLFRSSFASKANLCDAKVGEVFDFEYLQPLNGEPERYQAKVIEPVCYLTDDTIKRMNRRSRYRRNDPEFKRTNHIVTCETADGNVRQFYCERVVNCRRAGFAGLLT
jgi:MFS superfamily sulfate permease-like transporter